MSVERVASAWAQLGLRRHADVDGGQRNVLVLMHDRRGGRWVLRGHVRDRDARRADWQAALQTFLAADGYPTAPHALTREDTFVAVDEGTPWTLARWLPGRPYSYGNRTEAEAAGRALAALHERAASFAIPAVTMAHNRATSAWLADPQAELDALARRFGERARDLRWIEDLLSRVPSRLGPELPRGLVHGDFHGANLAFAADQVVGVFDFDVIQPDVLITDVARATVKFARTGRGSFDLRPHFARAFLAGYQTLRPLDDHEVRWAPVLWPIAHLRTAARYALADHLGDDSDAAFTAHLATARAAEALARTLSDHSV